ncbi:hypothetical protein ACTXT7_007050 [Hymenolepis weldensis]
MSDGPSKYGNGRKNHDIKSLRNEAPRRRGKPQYQEVVERKTTTRLSRQNDDDFSAIHYAGAFLFNSGRKRVEDNYSSESRTEASEQSDYSEDTYENIEVQRRNSRRPNRKEYPHTHIVEIYEYEEDEPAKLQGRQVELKYSEVSWIEYNELFQLSLTKSTGV